MTTSTKRKWSRRLTLLAAPMTLAVAGVALPATAAWARCGPDALVFAVQPTTTQVNSTMTPPVVVDVEQSGGQVDRSYNGPVTLTYAVNPDGAPEPTGNTVNAVDGVATFSSLTFSAVGFGFELEAETSTLTSAASSPFNIVSSLVLCSPGATCQSGTVSSDGTSASVVAAAASTSDVLTATGGGFPALSCTSYGGVITVTVTNRSKVITLTLNESALPAGLKLPKQFPICWGSPTPFTTSSGTTSAFNSANDEYEGLLPSCKAVGDSQACVQQQTIPNKCNPNSGNIVTTIAAPAGDPRMTY